MLVHYGRSGEEIKNKYGVERLTTCVSAEPPRECRVLPGTGHLPRATSKGLSSALLRQAVDLVHKEVGGIK